MPEQTSHLHNCCSLCQAKCNCDGDKCSVTDVEDQLPQNTEKTGKQKKRNISDEDREILQSVLSEARLYFNAKDSFIKETFSEKLITETMVNAEYLCDMSSVLELLPVYGYEHGFGILQAIQETFEDFAMPSASDIEYTKSALMSELIQLDIDELTADSDDDDDHDDDATLQAYDEFR
eukprot:GHVT01028554.1.p1 GENE.GHVT01028554.1~~GHVT01028554.1.p1  ORF type:complete len:178 (+),score=9.61 GHVT01028554.1:321-854(+)